MLRKSFLFLSSCMSLLMVADETYQSFMYKDKPIHPQLIQRFLPSIADSCEPYIVSLDIAAAYKANEFQRDALWEKTEGKGFRCQITDPDNERIFFGYRWIGTLANGLHVIKTFSSEGGSGTFKDLYIFSITSGKAYADNGSLYEQTLLTFIRRFPLGDRDARKITIHGNCIHIDSSDQHPKKIIHEIIDGTR